MIYFFLLLFISSYQFIFPKISVIVPIYNTNKYLKECLDSLINQTLKNIEIICINDGSTDNSFKIVMNYISDNRFIFIDKINSGYGDSLNNGIEFVSGQYIGIVESDDFADKDMFETLYKYTKNGNIDIVRSNYYLYWSKKKKKKVKFKIMKSLYNKFFNPIEHPMIFLIPPSIWSGIYKKDLLIKNNIKFLSTPGASYQDTSFFLKTLFKSKEIFFLNKSFLNYRQTNEYSSVYNKTLSKALFVNIEFYEFEKYSKIDLKSYYKIEKFYNTKKIKTLIWNLKRIKKKKEYIKFLYNDIYKILINHNYLENSFNKFEKIFFNFLVSYGEIIALDFYLHPKKFNKLKLKI